MPRRPASRARSRKKSTPAAPVRRRVRRAAAAGAEAEPVFTATPQVAVCLAPYPDYQIGILQGVRAYLTAHPGAFAIVTHAGSPYLRPGDLPAIRCAGVIANIAREQQELFEELRVPLIKIGSRGPEPGRAPMVVEMDGEQAGRVAASHLAGLGLTALGVVGVAGAHWSQTRLEGFAAFARALGLEVARFDVQGGDEIEVADRAALADWLRSRPRPGAIFAVTDLLARRVTEAARGAGLAVPREQAVLGFNNGLYECLFAEPHLSSVPQDRLRLGYEAARLLHAQLAGRGREGAAAGVRVRAGPAVRRRSTALLAWQDPELRAGMDFFFRQMSDVAGLAEVFDAYPEPRLRLLRRLEPTQGGATDPAEAARLRLVLAEQLTRESELPLARVAECSGYWEEPRLAAAFRDAFGCDPGPYRVRYGRVAQA